MIKVNILNKEECVNLFKFWGEFSCVCYATPKKFAKKVGQSCLETKHYSGSRSRHIIFEFEGISRACADQMVRHSIGTAKNMQSGRYVDLKDFEYHVPSKILKNEKALEIYKKHMEQTKENYKEICSILEADGFKGESVYECARGIAPMNHCVKLTMSFTVEALINFMNKRLCVCSQEEIQKVAKLMKAETLKLLPELNGKLVPACEASGYCPESAKRTCGRYPQKEVTIALMNEYKKNKHFQEMIDRKVEREK